LLPIGPVRVNQNRDLAMYMAITLRM